MNPLRALCAASVLSVFLPLALAPCAQAQPPREGALVPGITIWVYDLGDPLTQNRRPTIAEGQTPNHYAVYPKIDFKTGFDTPQGKLTEHFAGEVRGWLNIETEGQYVFNLHCDDGAAILIDGKSIADTELPPAENFYASGGLHLNKGLHALSIPFYQNKGKFQLSLEWRPPDMANGKFELVPESALRTEAGQTFAVSPGPKRWYYGRDPNRPGDGRPLESVHPSFTLENFRGPDFQPAVGGLTFLPDGRLAVCTWDPTGSVYLLSDLDNKEKGVTVKKFASGLGEPLGIAYWNGDLYVTQKQEITRLRDTDGDGVADEYYAIASGWPASQNYHEFSFNLVPLDNKFYITTSVPLKSGVTNYAPGSLPAYAVGDTGNGGPGCAWQIDPTTGKYSVFARGLRAPNGLTVGPDGELFGCDNQGCWLPSSRLNHIHKDGFYGHQTEPNGTTPAEPPVCWFPHGEIGNSPTEPILIPDGPYKRQLLVGDVTHGGINRVFIENVDGVIGHYQGCVFQFAQGLEAGVNRLAWGPDGCLYVGGIGSNGNWNHKNKKFGLQRLRPNGHTALEMAKVESRADGFLITFSLHDGSPILTDLTDPANYEVQSWRYQPTIDYGGPKLDVKKLSVSRADASSFGDVVFIKVDGLEAGTVVYLRLRNFKDARHEEPFTTEAWYTLNALSPISGPGTDDPLKKPRPKAASAPDELEALVHDLVKAPRPMTERPARAARLFDGTAESLANWIHTDGKPCHWKLERGELLAAPSAQLNTGGDLVTREKFGDCYVHLEWLCPPGGSIEKQTNANSGVKLQSRYEVQIMNSPAAPHPAKFNEAGSIYRQKPADTNASLGAGVWQSYDILFRKALWTDGKKVKNARMTVWWNGVLVHNDVEVKDKTGASESEAPGDWPLLLQSHPNEAAGPVRYRNVWIVKE